MSAPDRHCSRCENPLPCRDHPVPSSGYAAFAGGYLDTLADYGDWEGPHDFDPRAIGRGMLGACLCGWHESRHPGSIWADHARDMRGGDAD